MSSSRSQNLAGAFCDRLASKQVDTRNANEEFGILGVRGDKGNWHGMMWPWQKWKQNSRKCRTVCVDQGPGSTAGSLSERPIPGEEETKMWAGGVCEFLV